MTEATTYVPCLETRYHDEIKPKLLAEFKHQNVHQVGGLEGIVVNMGVDAVAHDHKLIEGVVQDLAIITDQKPVIGKACKSIVQFKLREGDPVGVHVTLRGGRMWEFPDRLLAIALPQIRNSRDLSAEQFDGYGNYTFGLTEQFVFHGIDQDIIDHVRGMDIAVVTMTVTDDEGRMLLKHLGFPFREN